jgi:hypothetical protein
VSTYKHWLTVKTQKLRNQPYLETKGSAGVIVDVSNRFAFLCACKEAKKDIA